MEISTYEAWIEWTVQDRQQRAAARPQYIRDHPEYLQRHLERQYALDRKRSELLGKFPYSVVAEGEHAEHDYAARWCWQNIGPKNGRCDNYNSTYPACPLVLETEYIEHGVVKLPDGTQQSREWKSYRDPGAHQHQGDWTSLWLSKTGHDYGFNIFFFAHQQDYARFLAAFPTFTWDASWDRL